jgi:hypothetical protein
MVSLIKWKHLDLAEVPWVAISYPSDDFLLIVA